MRIAFLVVVVTSLAQSVFAQEFADAAQARQFLLSRGLRPAGLIWVTRHDASLQRVAESLDALDRRHHTAMTASEQMLLNNEAIRARLAKAEAAERAKNGQQEPAPQKPSVGETDSLRAAPPSPATKLHSQLLDVTGLGENTPLQQAMIELVNARAAVQLATLRIIREAPTVEAEYEPLKADARIARALKALGQKNRLGPSRNYRRDLNRAKQIAAGAFQNEIPVYLQSGRWRVPAILNEAHPVTLTFHKEAPLILTTSAAQRLGLGASDHVDAPRELEISGRRVRARPAKLTSLRIGSAIVKDPVALVLPPEAEDLGSHFSASALPGYSLELAPPRMFLRVTKLSAN